MSPVPSPVLPSDPGPVPPAARRPLPLRIIPILLLGVMLAFPALTVRGALSGLLLWFRVVLPTLAPFLICTQMVVALDGVRLLTRPFYPAIRALFGLSVPGAYILLCGLLCGYPLGARMCADFLTRGEITYGEAQYLLSVCNHPSPMFLLGFVVSQLQVKVPPALLLTCLYLPVLPLSLAARKVYQTGGDKNRKPSPASQPGSGKPVPPPSLEDILFSTADTMVLIGGCIMLFSVLAIWIRYLPFFTPQVKACLAGFAEITTGINQICGVFPPRASLLPVVGAVAFGGLSGIFQTKSVIKNAGLSIRHYIIWKAVHACLSCMALTVLLRFLPLPR